MQTFSSLFVNLYQKFNSGHHYDSSNIILCIQVGNDSHLLFEPLNIDSKNIERSKTNKIDSVLN